jgi:aconitate hydratase
LTGHEVIEIAGVASSLAPGALLDVRAERPDGTTLVFPVRARVDTPIEMEYYRHGGLLPFVLRRILAGQPGTSGAA